MEYVLYRLVGRVILFLGGICLLIVFVTKQKSSFMNFITFKRITSSLFKDIILRIFILMLGIAGVYSAGIIVHFIQDIPYIIDKEYLRAEGYMLHQEKGGRDLDTEKRYLHLRDKVTGENLKAITVFATYIEKSEYIKVEYLPHTRYGRITISVN